MAKSINSRLLACTLFLPTAAVAQETVSKASVGIEEVVVTAEKRETNLQDTAVAISAFSGDALEKRGIDDMSNLQSYIPNLHVGQEQDGFKISLRGIGLQGTSSISDPGVAFYIDGFYIPRPAGGSAVFFDIARIEVLRGPQGTLYGRNATGGVVNVISNEPQSKFEGLVGASYGNRDLIEERGMINVPMGDNAAARFSVVHTEEDGYVKNLSTAPGTHDFFGTDGDLTMHGQILFDVQDDLEILLSGSYSKLNGTGIAMSYLERNIGGPPPTQVLLRTIPAEPANKLEVNNDNPAFNDTKTYSTFIRVKKTFDDVEAFLQAGKYWQNSHILQDFDGSPVSISIFNKDQDNDAASVEARLSSTGAEPLQWLIGGYYFSESTFIFRRVRLNGRTPAATIALPDFLLDESGDSSTIAGFGSATYSVADNFRITAGARYTRDKKAGTKVTRGNFGQPFPPDIPNATFPGEAVFHKANWKAGVEWDTPDGALLYANVSTGYKAGGFNITSNGAPYNPETVFAYQAGIKSNPLDGRAQINADAFHYAYDDMQLTTLTTINNAPGQFTTNATKSTIYGLELDGQIELTDELLFSASYAYVDAEFGEYYNTDPRNPTPVFNPSDPAGLGRTDLRGNKVPYVAKNTVTAGLQYGVDVGSSGSIVASINTTWHGKKFLREYNNPTIDKVGANTKTDATVTYFAEDIGLSITGYVTNIENNSEKTNIFTSPGFVGLSATTAYSKPRSYGVRVDYKF